MAKFILKIVVNSGAIYAADMFITGFTFSGNLLILAALGVTLAVFQYFVYPVIKILAFPVVFLTFGLFGTIANLVFLWALAYFVPELTIEGIMPLIWGAAVISVANLVFSWF